MNRRLSHINYLLSLFRTCKKGSSINSYSNKRDIPLPAILCCCCCCYACHANLNFFALSIKLKRALFSPRASINARQLSSNVGGIMFFIEFSRSRALCGEKADTRRRRRLNKKSGRARGWMIKRSDRSLSLFLSPPKSSSPCDTYIHIRICIRRYIYIHITYTKRERIYSRDPPDSQPATVRSSLAAAS